MVRWSLVLCAVVAVLWPVAADAQSSRSIPEPTTMTIDGRTVEVHQDGNRVVMEFDGERYTCTYHGCCGGSLSGPVHAGGATLDFAMRVVRAWEEQGGGRPTSGRDSNAVLVLFGVLFLAYGAVGLAAPQAAWWLSIGWAIKDAQPSELALVMHRIGGALAAGVGAFIVVQGI